MRPLFLLLAFLAAAPLPAAAQTFILVRHAEKADDSDDTALSAAGHARAERLAALVAEAGITHVFATEYRRTLQTVKPAASARGLGVVRIPARDTATLADRLSSLPRDAVALVAGHSNSTPRLLEALGHAAPVTIDDADFGSVFVAVMREGEAPAVVRLKY